MKGPQKALGTKDVNIIYIYAGVSDYNLISETYVFERFNLYAARIHSAVPRR